MSTLLRGGRVLLPDGAQELDVLLADGLIGAVGSGLESGVAEVVDCSGMTVLPGLIDAHVHLAMAGPVEADTTPEQARHRVAANARALLAAGVTTARDASGPSAPLLVQRTACAADAAAGPELLLCCEGIATVGGHGTEFNGEPIVTEVDGPEQARQAVQRLKRIGADWVKVMLNGADDELELDEAELTAIVEEARELGLPVAAHASNARAVALAVGCRVDSIEHGNDVDEALASAMAEHGIALVTTTNVYRVGAGCGHGHDGEDPLRAFEPRVQEKVRAIMAVRVAGHEQAIPAALAAGVRVVLGTDAVTGPPGTQASELRALQDLGLSPREALHAATAAGAELLGLADRGVIAEGLRADLLVVHGRPDEDLTSLSDPVLVLRGGELVVDRR